MCELTRVLRANYDVQFLLDPVAVVDYVIKYKTKPEKRSETMFQLMRNLCLQEQGFGVDRCAACPFAEPAPPTLLVPSAAPSPPVSSGYVGRSTTARTELRIHPDYLPLTSRRYGGHGEPGAGRMDVPGHAGLWHHRWRRT